MKMKSLIAAGALLLLAQGAQAVPFTAGCTDCPLSIGPSPGTTSSFLNVGTSGTIADLDLFLNLTHTFTGDLDIFLISPNLTTVHLFDSQGGSGNDIFNVLFNDEAASPIDAFAPDYNPECDPAGGGCQVDSTTGDLLSFFDGENIMGTWELRIVDNLFGDGGTLLDWELRTELAMGMPEPGILILFGLGLTGLAFARRRR